jgi:hypothetical protein
MNKLILIIILSGSCLLVAGQSNFVKIYYPKVNQAELAITREDFRQASDFYKEAFSSVKSPFARDLFNAFVCKVLLNDFEGSKPYLFRLARKGVEISQLEQKEIFHKLKDKPDWENFKITYQQILDSRQRNDTEEAIEAMYANYKADLDSAYYNSERVEENYYKVVSYKRNKIISVTIKRDSLNALIDTNNVNAPKFMTRRFVNIQAEIDSVEVKYRAKVTDYLKSHPWPGEDELGINKMDLTFTSTIFNQLVKSQYNEYVFHSPNYSLTVYGTNYGTKKSQESGFLTDQAKKAISEGLLSPVQASSVKNMPRLIEIFKATVEDSTACVGFPEISSKVNKWLVKRRILSNEDKELYAYIEQNFFMPNAEDNYKKAFYQALKNKFFIFPQNVNREETTLPSCETAIELLKEATLTEEN